MNVTFTLKSIIRLVYSAIRSSKINIHSIEMFSQSITEIRCFCLIVFDLPWTDENWLFFQDASDTSNSIQLLSSSIPSVFAIANEVIEKKRILHECIFFSRLSTRQLNDVDN